MASDRAVAGPVVVGVVALAGSFALYIAWPRRPFSYDEAVTVGLFAKNPSVWAPFRKQFVFNNHPAFSFLLAVTRRVVGNDVAWMRVVPAAIGAVCVALLGGWTARRLGVAAGIAAAALLGTNPLFVPLARSARGYGLLALCALVATILLVAPDTWASRAGYVFAIGLGVATHLYAFLVVAAHAVYLAVERRWSWLVLLCLGSSLGLVAYAWTWRTLLRTGRARRGAANHDFLSQSAKLLLGNGPLAITIVTVLFAFGLYTLARRPVLLLAAAVPVVCVLLIWKVERPNDMYPRFLVVGVVGIAYIAARGVARAHWLLIPALVASAAMLLPQLPHLDAYGVVEQGAIEVTAARAAGLRPCAVGSQSLLAYVAAVQELRGPPTRRCATSSSGSRGRAGT